MELSPAQRTSKGPASLAKHKVRGAALAYCRAPTRARALPNAARCPPAHLNGGLGLEVRDNVPGVRLELRQRALGQQLGRVLQRAEDDVLDSGLRARPRTLKVRPLQPGIVAPAAQRRRGQTPGAQARGADLLGGINGVPAVLHLRLRVAAAAVKVGDKEEARGALERLRVTHFKCLLKPSGALAHVNHAKAIQGARTCSSERLSPMSASTTSTPWLVSSFALSALRVIARMPNLPCFCSAATAPPP